MVATATSNALARLRNTPAPKFIRVKEGESVTQIAVPDVKRWKGRLSKILDALPWEWIEPLDAKANIIGPRVDNDELGKATALEELELPEPDAKMGGSLAGLTGLLTLLLKAQDVALVRQSEAYSVVLDNNQKLLGTITSRLSSMEAHAHKSFEVINSLHNRLNLEIHNNEGDGDSLDGIVGQVLGHVMTKGMGGAADAKGE